MMFKQNAEQTDTLPDELERLLRQVESSTTHYEALGIARSASMDEIKLARQQSEALLQSSATSVPALMDSNEDSDLTIEPQARINRALNRVVQAFSVLSNFKKRGEYDRFAIVRTLSRQAAAQPDDEEIDDEEITDLDAPLVSAQATSAAEPSSKEMAVYTGKSNLEGDDNRRRSHRHDLSITALVAGYDRKAGKWQEAAETIDASRTGLNMRIRRRVRHGVILHLTLPLPAELRKHALTAPVYSVYAIVRRVEPSRKGVRVVGLEFVGERPPAGYLDKPWAAFQSKRWGGTDRRRKTRQERNDVIWIEYFTESMQCISQEAGRTENVSHGGLRVYVKAAPSDFELARVSYPDRGIESYAVVRNRYFGKDGFERLCLKFVDNDDLAGRANATLKKGTEVNYSEPYESDTDFPQSIESVRAETSVKAAIKNQKILVADDDQPLRKVLGKILRSAGYEVILVEDGKAAVEQAIAERPDLVITDGLMPKMHGFLVCQAIKALQSPPKVIMLTAVYTKMHYKWEAKEKYGADELMTKPFEVAELLDCIAKHLTVSQVAEPMHA
jgi:CheY-like chemotaxis protein